MWLIVLNGDFTCRKYAIVYMLIQCLGMIVPKEEDMKENAILITGKYELTICSHFPVINIAFSFTSYFSGQSCLETGSTRTPLRISDTLNLHLTIPATPNHVQLPNGSLISHIISSQTFTCTTTSSSLTVL